MRDRSPLRLIAVFVSILVVTGTIPAAAVGAYTDNPVEPREAVSAGFQDVSSNIEVWDRAALPLRIDSDNGDTVVGNVDQQVSIEQLNIDRARLDTGDIAVYDDQATLDLEFESKTFASTGQFANQDAQLIAAHIDGSSGQTDALDSNSPATANQLLSLLTAEGAEFDLVENYGTLDGNGELTGSYDLGDENQGPGFYVFFLVQDYDQEAGTWGVTDSGFEESNGDLSVSGDARVLGLDTAMVHEESSSATPEQQSYAAGSDVTFDVDGDEGDATTHAIVVYDEEEFEGRDVITEIDGNLNGDLSADQVTVRREIESVRGVASVQSSLDTPGVGALGDSRVSGVFSGAQLVEFVADQAGADDPLDETTDDSMTLDASVTVAPNTNGEGVRVGTLSEWEPGEYTYVHIASGGDSEITTTSGTVTITEPEDANPGLSKMLEGERGTVFQMPPGGSVTELGLEFGSEVSGMVTVSERESAPEDSLNAQEGVEDPVYLDITAPNGEGETVITATFQKSSLDGLDPNDLSLWNYRDGQWVELETTLLSETDSTVTLRAVTDSFSPFALGESVDTSDGSSPSESVTTDGDSSDSDIEALLRTSLDGVSSGEFSVGDGSDVLQGVSMEFDGESSGDLVIREFDRPAGYTDYEGETDEILTVVDLEPPTDVRYDSGSVTFELKQSALDSLDVSADGLQIQAYDTSSGSWETLDTEVIASDDETATLRADVSDFGTYVISRAPAQQQTTATPTETATPDDTATETATEAPAAEEETATAEPEMETETDVPQASGSDESSTETTSTEFPGLGITVTIVAFVMTLLALGRRRLE
jgi:hypothetical protein